MSFFSELSKYICSIGIFRYPIDWKNPIGYLIIAATQFIMNTYNFFFMATLMSFGIGGYLFLITVNKDMQLNLISIGKICKAILGLLSTSSTLLKHIQIQKSLVTNYYEMINNS